MASSIKHTDETPWYKQPLVWLVIAFPAVTVVAGFITLGIAIHTDEGVLIDDYYQQGKAINRVLTRDRQAAALGLSGHSSYNPDNQHLIVSLVGSPDFRQPDNVRLQLLHTTRGGIDVDQLLQADASGLYQLKLHQPLASGGWVVQLSTEDWRIHGRLFVPDRYQTALLPL